MRTDHHPGGGRLRRAYGGGRIAVMLAVLAASALILTVSPASAGAQPFKHACRQPLPGRAQCLALKLELGAQAQARPAGARALTQAAPAKKPYPGFLTPQLLHEAYGLPAETAVGSTQTIALVDAFNDPTAEADLAVYDQQFGLPACTSENGCFQKVNEEGKAGPLPADEGGWSSEISIDVQMARAICQSCRILLVEAASEEFSDLGQAVDTAARLGASVISNSYGLTETATYEAYAPDYDHPGVPILVSSGDCGYDNAFCPEDEVGAEYPADYPDVVSVGGTTLKHSGDVWTSTTWEEGGSGCSKLFSAPLWQSGVAGFAATGCGSGRAVADVSAIGDPNTGVDVYDSTPEEPGAPTGWGVWGGTSVASPILAGEFALAGGGNGIAFPGQTLYGHAGQASAFYDVLSGSNGSCAGASICEARKGFDGPTGLGSPTGLEAFAVAGTPESTSPPTVTGTAEQGQTLTAHRGSWSGEPSSFSLQWERCDTAGTACAAIAGATAGTYTATSADVGLTLRVRETVRNSTGPGGAYSAVTATVVSDVPAISGFSPSSGITGSTIIVEGSALDTTKSVTLDNLPASFHALSPTKLEVTVPDGLKKGKLTVTTAAGTVTAKGKYSATLSILSFKPTSTATGQTVTLKGIGFDSASTVAFDGVPAGSVRFVSGTKLQAVVPSGIATGPITVTNTTAPAGTVASATDFTP